MRAEVIDTTPWLRPPLLRRCPLAGTRHGGPVLSMQQPWGLAQPGLPGPRLFWREAQMFIWFKPLLLLLSSLIQEPNLPLNSEGPELSSMTTESRFYLVMCVTRTKAS